MSNVVTKQNTSNIVNCEVYDAQSTKNDQLKCYKIP